MKKTLLIIAAGLGSRYGGLKQIAPVGPNGEIIIEYSIYDAMRAGFDRIVFVIRHCFEDAFREKIGHTFENRIETAYVYQELDACLNGFKMPAGREKPWGTGHAILVAKEAIDGPFAVINADDYYGVEAFGVMAAQLEQMGSKPSDEYAMIGYLLRNTLSDYGTVSRGLCQHDAHLHLTSIQECTRLRKSGSDGLFADDAGTEHRLPGDAFVSMNLWGFDADLFEYLQTLFGAYLREHGNDDKSEFGIPTAVDALIRSGRKKVRILKTHDSWFGITYRQDQEIARAYVRRLIEQGVYPECLYPEDICS